MAFVPSIQSFIPSVGSLTQGGTPIWDLGKLYVGNATGDLTTAYLFRFDIVSGEQEKQVALTGSATNETFGVDPDGNVALSSSGITNFCAFERFSPDLVPNGAWGSSSTFWNVPNGLPYPIAGWTGMKYGNQALFFGTSIRNITDPVLPNPSGFPLWIQTGTPFGFLVQHLMDENILDAIQGPTTGSSLTAYIIGGPELVSDPQHLALYSLNIIPAGETTPTLITNTIVPTTIDATWTHIFHDSLVLDAADGNLIVPVWTTDAVTNAGYICKFNASTGALMWQVPVFVRPGGVKYQPRYSRIRRQKFAWFQSAGGMPLVTIIDTAAGVATDSYAVPGVSGGDVQSFDDTTGAIVLSCGFSETAGSPVRLNATPSSWSGQFAALYVIEAEVIPVLPGAATSYTRIFGFPPGARQ